MRLDKYERIALKNALKDFNGTVYLFGSRLDDAKNGGDIDILLLPEHSEEINPLKLSLKIQTKFFSVCEQNIDVVVYRNHPFCEEIIKNAKKLNIAGI
jgi:predicted nucleotidyltransferase